MIILDTNVLSELMRPKPSPRVVTWVARQRAAELFTTSITEAEIFYGIELLSKGKRREGLLAAAEKRRWEHRPGVRLCRMIESPAP
jgi:toxin FitB